jgi:hypothetical protein
MGAAADGHPLVDPTWPFDLLSRRRRALVRPPGAPGHAARRRETIP